MAVSILLEMVLRLSNPQVMRQFIDSAIEGHATSTLTTLGIVFFFIALLAQALSIGSTYTGEQVAWTATNKLRVDLLRHTLSLDQSFYKKHAAGELLERIDGDVNTLSNFFSRFSILIVGNLILIIGVLTLLFLEDWRIGISISIFALLSLLLMLRVRVLATPHWIKVRQISAEFFGFLGEQLAAAEDILPNGGKGFIIQRFHEIWQRWFPTRLKAMMMTSFIWVTNNIISALGTIVAFGLSTYFWSNGELTIGSIYLIFHYTNLIRQPLSQLRNQVEDLQRAEASIHRIRDLFAEKSKLIERGKSTLPRRALSVEFNHVTFSYDNDEEDAETAITDLNFSLREGKVLGLLGRTGSGKSTIARLLLRLYDPTQGSINLGGLATDSVPLAELRRSVGLVSQEVQLFQASIRDNLTFFNPAISDANINSAMAELGMLVWLEANQFELDTQIGAGGETLSAGQAQLLAFTRVFLSDPGLVILDEATSRIDPVTNRLIERAIVRLLRDRTGIIIAHHLDTVHRSDEILILKDGTMLEHGPREQLESDQDSHFARLLRSGMQETLA